MLNIGVIGSGGIAQACLMPGFEKLPDRCCIVAIADINRENAKKAAERFQVKDVYSDYQQLINRDDIHAVCVATPNAFHKQPTIDALSAGKHVFVEKPMAMNAQECREMIIASRKAGKIIQVGLHFRFSGIARFMKQFISDGNMGELYYARAQALRRRGVPTWGVFIDKEKQGGGPLIDIGVHILDFTLYLMGYPKPVSVFGKTYNAMGTNPKHWNAWGDYDREKFTVEDFAVALIRFENNATITLETSFMSNVDDEIFRSTLFGTDAGAEMNLFGENPIKIYTERNKQLFDMIPRNVPKVPSPYDAEIEAFVNAILNNTPSPVPPEQGMILNAIFDAIYESNTTGKEVPVDCSVENTKVTA